MTEHGSAVLLARRGRLLVTYTVSALLFTSPATAERAPEHPGLVGRSTSRRHAAVMRVVFF
jgi:hypothetical protein